MNWKNEAIERLKSYECTCNAIKSLALQEAALMAELHSMGHFHTDAPVRHSPGDREERRLDQMVKLELIRSRLQQNKLWKNATEQGLSALSQEERQVLQRLYMHPKRGAMEQLSQALGMERSTVYRLRDKALERFTLATFGIDQ